MELSHCPGWGKLFLTYAFGQGGRQKCGGLLLQKIRNMERLFKTKNKVVHIKCNNQSGNRSLLHLEKRDGKEKISNHRENWVKSEYQMVQLLSITTLMQWGNPRYGFYLHSQVCLVTFPMSWCCWQGHSGSGSHLAGALCSCSIVLCQPWAGVSVTPELLCPVTFSQSELRIFYFKCSVPSLSHNLLLFKLFSSLTTP